MKKIVLYGINYAPEPIGVGRFSGELGAYLASQDIQVEVVTAVPHYPGWKIRNDFSNWYSTERMTNERITRCPIFLHKNLRGIWRLVAPLSFALSSAPVALWRILACRPDAILCVEPTFFTAPVALLAGKLIGARCFLHVQDLEIDAAFAVNHIKGAALLHLALAAERIIMRSFYKIITISHRMAQKIIEKGISEHQVKIVRNWVDLEKIRPLLDASAYRDELGISSESFVALYAGNIGPKQALAVVLEAARKLQGEKRITFVIAGEGPDKQTLKDKYDDLPNIRFLPIQPEERLCELLNLANVHLLPQDQGAADLVLPSKLGGMLASGKPCVVMANEGTELFDFLSRAAVLISPGDSAKLARTIFDLFSGYLIPPIDPERAKAFDMSKNLQLFLEILELNRTSTDQCGKPTQLREEISQ